MLLLLRARTVRAAPRPSVPPAVVARRASAPRMPPPWRSALFPDAAGSARVVVAASAPIAAAAAAALPRVPARPLFSFVRSIVPGLQDGVPRVRSDEVPEGSREQRIINFYMYVVLAAAFGSVAFGVYKALYDPALFLDRDLRRNGLPMGADDEILDPLPGSHLEGKRMRAIFDERNLKIRRVFRDPQNFFRCVALQAFGTEEEWYAVRRGITTWLRDKKDFVVDPASGTTLNDLMLFAEWETWDEYVAQMSGNYDSIYNFENYRFADTICLYATAELFGANVEVYCGSEYSHWDGEEAQVWKISPQSKPAERTIRLFSNDFKIFGTRRHRFDYRYYLSRGAGWKHVFAEWRRQGAPLVIEDEDLPYPGRPDKFRDIPAISNPDTRGMLVLPPEYGQYGRRMVPFVDPIYYDAVLPRTPIKTTSTSHREMVSWIDPIENEEVGRTQ